MKKLTKSFIIAQFVLLSVIILCFNPCTNQILTLYYAKKYDLNKGLFYRQIKTESYFRCFVKSKKGAIGVGQIMYPTATYMRPDLKKWELYLPWTNLDISCRYLQHLLKNYSGNYSLALAAYNWGEKNVNEKLRENDIKIENEKNYTYLFLNVRETYTYLTKILR
ncbi:MAG: lytic transglycosylase domain-containing protein [Candidatus Cloacimonetes bacterium]|nr:lytic transglycosylase domain-containing protein [Candidatus Cloacimonadota bacterium]